MKATKFSLKGICLGVFGLLMVLPAYAGDGRWSAPVSGDWWNPEMWDEDAADGAGATAHFGPWGSAASLTVTLSDDVVLGALSLEATSASDVAFQGSGTLMLARDGASPTLTTLGSIGANVGVVLEGVQGVGINHTNSRNFILSGENRYRGLTTISQGVVQLGHGRALGDASTLDDATVLSSGASIRLRDGVVVSQEVLYLAGNGADFTVGALHAQSGAKAVWNGAIYLNGATRGGGGVYENRIGTGSATAELVVGGVIRDGVSSDVQVTGLGTVTFSGANVYSGHTTIYRGTLRLEGGNDRLPTGTVLELGGTANSATFDLNGSHQRIAGVRRLGGAGSKQIVNTATGRSILTVSGDADSDLMTYSGNLSLVKEGSGSLTLSADSRYSGDTLIRAGTLVIGGLVFDDDADVYFSSGALLNFATGVDGVDSIRRLYLDGVSLGLGSYGALDNWDADYQVSFITGEGMLLVTAAIPEPGAVALGIFGVIVLGMGRFRRKAAGV